MIFSRMGRASSDDVTAEDVSKTEKAFKSVGVALRDAKGEFRAVPQVLDELSTKWNNLNSVQRSYVAEQAAGKSNARVA